MPPSAHSKDNVLKRLFGLERFGIRPGLSATRKLLSILGDPHLGYPCVHIAGTNGKGSTASFISSALKESGYRVGLYTSPHLIKFNERIKINGTDIKDADVVRLAFAVEKACMANRVQATFFEFTTAVAFLYFREKGVQIAVIEAGMGGRLDATNVVSPLVSVITGISLDHTERLGKTIEKIAMEKAGIIKEGAFVITGERGSKAGRVIGRVAKAKGAPLFALGRDFKAINQDEKRRRFDYIGMDMTLKGVSPSLYGSHQFKNSCLAIGAIECLKRHGWRVNGRSIRRGLKRAVWPGRLETIRKRPLVMLDAAHNPEGAKALKRAMSGMGVKRLILVVGMMSDKDIDGFLRRLAPCAHAIIATQPKTKRAAPPSSIIQRLRQYPAIKVSSKDVAGAIRLALDMAGREDAICVTGSIYTIGEAKEVFRHLRA